MVETGEVPMAGTSLGLSDDAIKKAREELEKYVKAKGYMIPDRGNLDDPTINWKFGKPNYSKADLAFFKGKSRSHKSGSLEKIVEDLVKTWEMEASHKNFEQWTTVNHEKYYTTANGGAVYKGVDSANAGNYNWLLHGCKKELYNAEEETFDTSHHLFRNAFPNAFSWELLDVFSPPPKVAFSWRHWAEFTGSYKENEGKGDLVEMYGFAVVTVDENTKICGIEIYYKPEIFLEVLEGKKPIESLNNGKGGFPDFYNSSASACPFAKALDA